MIQVKHHARRILMKPIPCRDHLSGRFARSKSTSIPRCLVTSSVIMGEVPWRTPSYRVWWAYTFALALGCGAIGMNESGSFHCWALGKCLERASLTFCWICVMYRYALLVATDVIVRATCKLPWQMCKLILLWEIFLSRIVTSSYIVACLKSWVKFLGSPQTSRIFGSKIVGCVHAS